MDRKNIEKKANTLTDDFLSPPIPVLEIAQGNGVEVVFADFGKDTDKIAGFCDFQAEKMYINASDPINRINFTIAHELGHWILHRPLFEKNPEKYTILPRFQSANNADPIESEANHFAACLLVPKKLLLPVNGVLTARLAGIFQVSHQMMAIRLKNV